MPNLRRKLPLLLLTAAGALVAPRLAFGDGTTVGSSTPTRGDSDEDRFSWRVGSETYVQLFERAAFFGPTGALVRQETHAPIHESAVLRVDDVDVPWRNDSLDVELGAFGTVDPGETSPVRHVDGDVSIASVRHRFGPGYVTLGRQLRVGGAARFSRFDGAAAGIRTPVGIALDAYGGLRVLPRWDQRPGYQLLGSVADSLVRDPDAVAPPSRGEEWLAGGRLSYRRPRLGEAGVSFHEERSGGGLGRRELALDLDTALSEAVAARAIGLLDIDSLRVSEARVAVDFVPARTVDVDIEAQHTTPSLLLSRQSVLSVFSTDAFDEAGGVVSWRPIRLLTLSGAAYVDFFEDSRRGGRGHGEVRLTPPGWSGFGVGLRYGRVVETVNGYTVLRAAAWASPMQRINVRAETWAYLYDQPIDDISTAVVGAGTVGYRFSPAVAVDVGGSVARSPFSLLDAQALARLVLDFEGGRR